MTTAPDNTSGELHYTAQQLVEYFEDRLADHVAASITEHLGACDACALLADTVSAAQTDLQGNSYSEFDAALQLIDGWSARAHGDAYVRHTIDETLRQLQLPSLLPSAMPSTERLEAWRGGASHGSWRSPYATFEVPLAPDSSVLKAEWMLEEPVAELELVVAAAPSPTLGAPSPGRKSALRGRRTTDLLVRLKGGRADGGSRGKPEGRLVLLVSLSGGRPIVVPLASDGSLDFSARFENLRAGKYVLVIEPERSPQ